MHHKLTLIHPFPNGNGRHARLLANIFMYSHEYSLLPWGACPLQKQDMARKKYLAALKKADQGKIEELLQFAETTFDIS